jgi:hypothetical protein
MALSTALTGLQTKPGLTRRRHGCLLLPPVFETATQGSSRSLVVVKPALHSTFLSYVTDRAPVPPVKV